MHIYIYTYIYTYIYIYSETSLLCISITSEYITQENDGNIYIYENLKSPYITILTCQCLKNNCHLVLS